MSRNNEDRTSVLINLAEEMYSAVRDLPIVFTGGVAIAYLEYIKGIEFKRPPGDIDMVTLENYLPIARERIIQKYQKNIRGIEGLRRSDESRIILWSPYEVWVELYSTSSLNPRYFLNSTIEVGKIRVIDWNQILALKLDSYLYPGREKDLIDVYRLILLDAVDAKDLALVIKNVPKDLELIIKIASILKVDLSANGNIREIEKLYEKIIEKLYEKIGDFPQFDNSEKRKIRETLDIARAKLRGE